MTKNKIHQCPHDNHIYLITFDRGIGGSDVWNICKYCSTKPEFSRHIISKDELLKSPNDNPDAAK